MSEESVHEDIISENPDTYVEPEQSQEPVIPEKYQGKALEDIIKMHQEAEAALSRQGNELGATRDLNDRLLQTLNNPKPEPEPEQTFDWDYEPEKAASDLVSKEVGAVKRELSEFKKQQEINAFKAQYPNFEQDSSSPEFLDWVKASEYRTNLYQKNYDGIDLTAARELMQGWNDVKSSGAQEDKREQDLKAATMEKGASSGGSRKKRYSRAEIRKLMRYDRKAYEAQRGEIDAAYLDGRVDP